MVTVILNKLGTYEKIVSRNHEYGYCKLFIKLEHDLFTPSLDVIDVCKEDKKCQRKLRFNRVGSYGRLKLRTVDVYFNRFDIKHENPLILVLKFTNPLKEAPNRYYRLDNIDSDLGQSQDLKDLKKYTDEEALLTVLYDENNKLKTLLTFDIGRTKGHSPPKGNNITYNGNKINIEDTTLSSDRKLSENGFKKYKHTPQHSRKAKICCLVYNNDPLSNEKGRILSDLKVKPDCYINVYWSSKADVHVLLEIVYPETVTENEFYVHNMTSKLFWEKLNKNNFQSYTGYDLEDEAEMYHKLTNEANKILIHLLKTLESNLLKILFFLVDRFNGKYGENDVKQLVGHQNHRLLGSKNKVSVVDITKNTQLKCLSDEGFRVYEHDFNDVVRFSPFNQHFRLKFIRSDVENMNFDLLTIYIDETTHTSYMYGSYKIEVTVNSNFNFKYKWIRHSCENDIFNTKFRVQFKGQSVTFNLAKPISDLNPNLMFVYFYTETFDTFVLLVFTSKNDDKIWYLTYDNFKKNVASEKELEISSLLTMAAYTKSQNIGSEFGYSGSLSDRSLDPNLKSFLDQERVKHCVIYIQLDNNNQLSYKSGLVLVNVSEQNNQPFDGYKTLSHSFSSNINFYDISINFQGLSKMLDINSHLGSQKITSVSIYYNNTNTKTPLMICVSSDNYVNKYFNYSEFIYNTDNNVKLSDLKLIREDQIQTELQRQYTNLISNITFDPFSTGDYPGFNVSDLNPYGNYKYYIHKPSQCFNYIELKNTGLYELDGFRDSDYRYGNLLSVFIYYHSFDKDNSYPLIIQLHTKNVQVLPKPKANESNIDEYKVDYVNIFYCLAEIDSNTFKKTYKKTGSSNKSFTSMLDETYTKLKGKIDINFGDLGSNIIDNLLYSVRNNSLYVYFYKNDPRALAFCYDNKAYKRYFLDGTTSKWINIPSVRTCFCDRNQINTELLNVLKELSVSLGLIKPEGSTQKKILETPVKIDLSRTDTATYGDSNNIRVSAKMDYGHCDLFCYYTHSISTLSAFKISSFIRPYGLNKTISMNEPVDNLLSVNVYFNIYVSDKPVLVEFIFDNGKRKYLKGLDREENSFDASSIIEFNETQFVEDLIEDSDRINNRITYKLDKTIPYNNVIITPITESENGFTRYNHVPKGNIPKMSNVLNNKRMLVGRKTNKVNLIGDIQNKVYNDITVYWMNINSGYPILAQFNDSKTNTYLLTRDPNGLYWKSEIFTYKDPSTTRNKLNEIVYPLKNSVIAEINNFAQFGENYSYEIKHIDNMLNSYGVGPKTKSYNDAKKISLDKKIKVSDETLSFSYLGGTSFKCYKHDLSDLKQTSEASDIGGIRLFLKTPGVTNPFEIDLYDNSSPKKNRTFLYYTPGLREENKNELYVYFYNQDFRPLLLCYNGGLYRRIDNNKNVDWYKDPKIKCSGNQNIKSTLNEVYSLMKRKMIFVKDGQVEKINTSRNNKFGTFYKDSFSPKDSGGNDQKFHIPISELIGQARGETTNLTNLLDQFNSKQFDSISVYRTGEGQSIQHILLLEFINDLQRTYFKRIDEVGKYWVEESISDYSSEGLQSKLKTIKSDITETVIYEVDSTQPNYNSDITIVNASNQLVTGFNKWTHTPTKVTYKKSLFLCSKKKLMRRSDTRYQELSEINVNKYNSVSVYFGNRAKDGSNNRPLVIELINNPPKSDSSTFYQHNRDGTNYYWESVNIDTKTNNKLNLKLQEVEFRLVDSVVILLDKTDTDGSYNEGDVSDAITKLHPKTEISRLNMNDKKIEVSYKTEQNGLCVKDYGYKLVCHNIEHLTSAFGTFGESSVSLRFLIPGENSTTAYNQLTLYKNDKPDPENVEYIYYTNGKNDVYVYFYGDQDPRPLLVVYNGKGYRPKSKERYFSDWVMDSKITKCLCQDNSQNTELLSGLFDVVNFLNEVRLNELPKKTAVSNPNKPGNHDEAITYDTFKFKGQKIEIKVSYENKSCYRVYSHKPNGTGSNGSAFRLGTINYDNKVANGINYSMFNELLSVSLYYGVYDKSHKHPLLVALKFKGNHLDYYELDDNREVKWRKLEGNFNSEDIEKTVYNIRTRLNIAYSDTQKQNKLFDPKDCKEDNPDLGLYVGAPMGGLAGAGALGGGGYLIYAKFIVTAISVAPS